MLTHFTFAAFVAVGLGGALGAWLRWGLTLWLNARHPVFPVGTFAANALGGFLVGVAIAYFAKHPVLSVEWRLFVITGFLGGLTTFSTFSAEVVSLIERSEIGWALAVAGSHLAVSLLLTGAGLYVYRSLS